MMRTLSGPLGAQDLGGGFWQLTAGDPGVQVFIRVPEGASCAMLRQPDLRRLDVEWHDGGVAVRVHGAQGVGVLEPMTAIIHEAKNRLYEGLPLARFDAKARQFWMRVFLLIRIPGGRYLLRLIARRKR